MDAETKMLLNNPLTEATFLWCAEFPIRLL